MSSDDLLDITNSTLMDTITFKDELAVLNGKSYSYTRQNDLVRFIAVDTSRIFGYDPASGSISQHVGIYQPKHLESSSVATPNGVREITLIRQERYARVRNGQLRFALLYFYYTRSAPVINSSTGETVYDNYDNLAISAFNNELNINVF